MAWKVERCRVNVVIPLSGTTVVSADIPAGTDQWASLIYYETPGFSANVSGDFTVRNPAGGVLYTSSTDIMSSTRKTTIPSVEIPILGGGYVVFTLNAVPGSAAGVSATPSTATMDFYGSN